LTVIAAAETHIHADYLSGLRQCAEAGMKIYASGTGGIDWQYFWLLDSKHPHQIVKHADSITIGTIRLDVLHTPGHTPEHLSYLIFETQRDAQTPLAIISGDFLFVGDLGRPDLLETAAGIEGTMRSSATSLYQSLQHARTLLPSLLVLPNHSAGSSCGKAMSQTTLSTLGYELQSNPTIRAASSETAFVDFILAGQPEPPPYFARMKHENRQGPKVLSSLPSPRQLGASDLSLLDATDVVVLDTRSWEEYRQKRFRGSLFAPLEKEFPTLVGSYVEPNERICLVVEESRRDEAVRDCVRVGLDQIPYVVKPALLASLPSSDLLTAGTSEYPMRELEQRRLLPDTYLLDVRKGVELTETGRVKGAGNIPHVQIRSRYRELPREKNIHLWCRTGNRSRFAYSMLERLGFHVTLLDGGIAAWQEQNGEMIQS
jgi:hydroxyacylglutathione hydrolase